MEKVIALLAALNITLTADQKKQLEEVIGKEFVPAETAAADKTKLDELTKQLAERDKDLNKLKKETAARQQVG